MFCNHKLRLGELSRLAYIPKNRVASEALPSRRRRLNLGSLLVNSNFLSNHRHNLVFTFRIITLGTTSSCLQDNLVISIRIS